MPRCLNRRFTRLARRALLVLLASLCSTAGYAQGCALCYSQAASSGARIIQGLRSGILVLVIPPMLMSIAISVLAYRKRNQFRGADESLRARRDFGW